MRSARLGDDTAEGRTTCKSPDIERNVSDGPPVPTESERWPRPPWTRSPMSELRSPDSVVISIRTSPAGARSPSPLTVSMANGPGPARWPASLRSPLVVATVSERTVAARISTSPDTVRTTRSASAVATMSRSPETASTAIRPPTAWRVTSPDVVR